MSTNSVVQLSPISSTDFIEGGGFGDKIIEKKNCSKYVMFPIQHNAIWQMYKRQVECFWRVEEVEDKLAEDVKDWNQKLNPDERYFISMVLAFFAASDGIVLENLALRFIGDIELSEARAFYGFQIAMENIHSEMYSLMIDTLIKDETEKSRLFNAMEEFPCVQAKANWAEKWIGDLKSSFATRLVAFACVEGIFFSSSFASIYWIKKRGLMPGLTFSNELISRDESMHTDFAVLLYNTQIPASEKLTTDMFYSIVKDAVKIETEFITQSIPCKLIGMNADLMTQYIEYVADRLCVQLGYSKCFGSLNPFDFMILQSTDVKANFFERTVSAYALATKQLDDNVFDNNDADF